MSKPKDITIGAGRLYVAELDANGKPKGLRYLGDSEGFTLSSTPEQISAWSGDGPVAQKLYDLTTSIERAFSMVLNEVNLKNLALFIIGEDGLYEQTAETAETEAFADVELDVWYSIGVEGARVAGYKDITVTSVDETGGPGEYVAADYDVDEERGLILFRSDGDIEAGDDITVTFNTAAGDYGLVSSNDRQIPDMYLKYIEDPRKGRARDVIMPRCTVRPEGDMELKSRETHQQITLNGDALVPEVEGWEAVHIIDRDAS